LEKILKKTAFLKPPIFTLKKTSVGRSAGWPVAQLPNPVQNGQMEDI
jgi:hypothetical protein